MVPRKLYFAAFALVMLALFSQPVLAAYTWVDDQGVYHITDYPKPVPRKDLGNEKTPAPDVAPEVNQEVKPPMVSVPTPAQVREIPAPAAALSTSETQTVKPLTTASQTTGTQLNPVTPATSVTLSQQTTTALTTKQETSSVELPGPSTPQKVADAGIMAFVMAFFMIFLVFMALLYIYYSLCLFLIAKKLDVPSPWIAWVPVINIWTILKAAGKPCWWVLLFLVPFVNFIVIVYVWMCIAENLGRNKWLGLLMLVPVVNLVFIGVLAFSKQEGAAPPSQEDHGEQEWEPEPGPAEEQESN